ncbi:MAG: hypothetical protein D6725_09070, partial [Planctomycetota bacterium]
MNAYDRDQHWAVCRLGRRRKWLAAHGVVLAVCCWAWDFGWRGADAGETSPRRHSVALRSAAESDRGEVGGGARRSGGEASHGVSPGRLPVELFQPEASARGGEGGGRGDAPARFGRGGLAEAAADGEKVESGGPSDATTADARAGVSPMRVVLRPEIRGRPGPAEWTVELVPPDAKPGAEVTLAITLRLEPGWHTYSITQPPGNAATATKLEVRRWVGLEPVEAGFHTEDAYEVFHPPGLEGITQQVHHGTVRWTRRFRVVRAPYGVEGQIAYQVCNDRTCLPVKRLSFRLGAVGEDAAAPPLPEAPLQKTPAQKTASPRRSSAGSADQLESLTRRGLLPFLLFAATSGFLALLTPCVFPMVPITISFFLKQAEQEDHRPLLMAAIYCGGIILTFTALGLLMAVLFGATSLNELANNPWLNLVIAAVLVFFGANLLGLFEIRVPSWLLNWSSQREGRGGVAGVLFMALTFTLVSFTCTFA